MTIVDRKISSVDLECCGLEESFCRGSEVILSYIRQLSRLKSHDHACILYESPKEKISSILAFACTAIRLGNICIYLAFNTSKTEIIDTISKENSSVLRKLVKEQLVVVDSSLFFSPEDCFEPDKAIAVVQKEITKAFSMQVFPCVISDMDWALRGEGSVENLFEFESRLNKEIIGCESWKAICQYDISKFHPKVIKEVLRTHPTIIWKGQVLDNCYYMPPEEFLSGRRDQIEVKRWLSHLEDRRLKLQELAENEACYQSIFENAGTAICIIDGAGIVSLINHQWERTLGFTKGEVEQKIHFLDFVHPGDKDAVSRYINVAGKVYEANPNGHEVRLVDSKGQTTYVVFSIHLIPSCEKYIISALDITELKNKNGQLQLYHKHLEELVKKRTRKLEKETEKSRRLAREISQLYQQESELRKQLENSSRENTKFTRFLVHELKTPLTPMVGSADILFEKAKSTEFERLASNIHRGAHSLNNRVNDLLDLVRGDMGLLHLSCGWIDLPGILKDVVCYMAVEFERRKQLVCLDIDFNTPLIWADAERLRQVIINLLENASKFTPAHGRIFIKTTKVGDSLIVMIRDTGCGIKKERQGTIFNDYSTQPKPDDPAANMGIGLHLCKLLMDLHGGDLWVNSKEGEGSEFSFSFPLDKDSNRR
ncbi:MAG: MEDS domain-containing protein [Dehalococcoidales bacterium]